MTESDYDVKKDTLNSKVVLSLCTGKVLRHPKGPMGLNELSFQHWFGLVSQNSFLYNYENGLVIETTKNG